MIFNEDTTVRPWRKDEWPSVEFIVSKISRLIYNAEHSGYEGISFMYGDHAYDFAITKIEESDETNKRRA